MARFGSTIIDRDNIVVVQRACNAFYAFVCLPQYPSTKELEVFKSLEVEEVDNRLFHTFTHPYHVARVCTAYMFL